MSFCQKIVCRKGTSRICIPTMCGWFHVTFRNRNARAPHSNTLFCFQKIILGDCMSVCSLINHNIQYIWIWIWYFFSLLIITLFGLVLLSIKSFSLIIHHLIHLSNTAKHDISSKCWIDFITHISGIKRLNLHLFFFFFFMIKSTSLSVPDLHVAYANL